MPRKKDPVDVSTIVQAVRSHANGAEFADILAAFAQRLERHKLQRWLDDLRARGTILTKGTKPLKYFVADGFEPPVASADLPGKATAGDMPGNDPGDPGRSPMPGNAGQPDLPATTPGHPGISRAPRNGGAPDLGGNTGAGDMPVTRPMNPGKSDLPATSAPKPGMPGNGAIMPHVPPAAEMPGNTDGANVPVTPGNPGMSQMPGNVPAGSMPATAPMNPGKSDMPAMSGTNAGNSGMPAKPGDANMPGNAGQPDMPTTLPANPGMSDLPPTVPMNPGMSKMPGNAAGSNLPATPGNPGKSDMPATSPANPGKAGAHPGRKRTAGRRDMPGTNDAASSLESSVVTDGDPSPEGAVDAAAKLIAVFDRFRSPGAAQAKRLVRAVWEWVGRVVPGGQNPLTRGAVCVAVVAAGLYLPSWIHLHGGAVFLSALATAVVAIVVAWVRQGSVAQPASAGTSVAPPAPPSRFASRKARIALVAGVLAIVVLTLGVFWYLRVRSRPSEPDIGAWVLSNVAPLPVRITALTTTYVSSNRSTGRATYDAVLAQIQRGQAENC